MVEFTAIESPRGFAVALAACPNYDAPSVERGVAAVLDAAGITLSRGVRVLVKPNLLLPKPLACTNPEVVAALCAWLLDNGARVSVADSPGFGRAASVARRIGMAEALGRLGLTVVSLDRAATVRLRLPQGEASVRISRHALESDVVFSVPRVKAHSQMLLSLAVKNCFGCVVGLDKALAHARQGRDRALFADCLAAIWAALPTVFALADGVVGMHVTGPGRGKPFALGCLGASRSAVALDEALCAVLGIAPDATPLGRALERRQAEGCAAAGWRNSYPLLAPQDFDAAGFELPRTLAHTSFAPARLVKSSIRRLWAALKP